MITQTIIPMTPEVIETEKALVLEYVYEGLNILAQTPDIETARNVWGAIERLSQITDALSATLGATNETVRETISQRDEAQRAYDELTGAIRDIDGGHPLIGELIDIVEEGIEEQTDELIWDAQRETRLEVADEAYDAARDIINQEMTDTLRRVFKVDFPQATRAVSLLVDGDTANIAPERLAALAEAISRLEE